MSAFVEGNVAEEADYKKTPANFLHHLPQPNIYPTMIGHQRLCKDQDMIKSALQKDITDRNRDSRLERKSPANTIVLCFDVDKFQQKQMAVCFIQKAHAKLPSKNNKKLTIYKGFTRLCKEGGSQTRLLERI